MIEDVFAYVAIYAQVTAENGVVDGLAPGRCLPLSWSCQRQCVEIGVLNPILIWLFNDLRLSRQSSPLCTYIKAQNCAYNSETLQTSLLRYFPLIYAYFVSPFLALISFLWINLESERGSNI